MRNWLSYGYSSLDEDVIWKTVDHDLKDIRREVFKALVSLEDTPLRRLFPNTPHPTAFVRI